MKPELMKNWLVVQNGRQIDIHAIDYTERREITVVADVRDLECGALIANAPRYKEALEKIVGSMTLAEGENADPRAQKMFDFAYKALRLETQCEAASA